MTEYIQKHYNEKLTLEDIAASANISKTEALRCFSESTHTTPVGYLISYRLKCAEHLLRSTSVSVTDIALSTGFADCGYFCKTFKKKYKSSPLKYRKALNQNELK